MLKVLCVLRVVCNFGTGGYPHLFIRVDEKYSVTAHLTRPNTGYVSPINAIRFAWCWLVGRCNIKILTKSNSNIIVTKFIRGDVAGYNKHPPFFEKDIYEVEVPEDEPTGTTVLSIAVRDLDQTTLIHYEISGGNENRTFAINPATGALIIARHLDYELIKKYNLNVKAFDGRHEASAYVFIYVTDVNDNAPVFDRSIYHAMVIEEEDRELPKMILQVSATDADSGIENNIVFFLSGEGIDVKNPYNSHFTIDSKNGKIFVMKALDRDYPGGHPLWTLTVFAQDEGGTGLASYSQVIVTVKDINDNSPVFKQVVYHCNVTENEDRGIFVTRMNAEDYDDPNEGANAKVTYSITENAVDEATGDLVFEMNRDTGEIKTRICCLDRENTPRYFLQVVAMDGSGLNGTATVDILVSDTNDSTPRFAKAIWKAQVEESNDLFITNRSILNVTVLDDDEINDFYFHIPETYKAAAEIFTIEAIGDRVGAIKLAKPLDFENPKQRPGFKFQILVSDIGEVTPESAHVAYSWVEIKVKDVNDNAPVFRETTIEVNVSENMNIGTTIGHFFSIDLDAEGKSEISYAINQRSDKLRQFSVSKYGSVKLKRQLDRETVHKHFVLIEASDNGIPRKTSTATLIVNVLDENDSAPRLSKGYFPILPENHPPTKIIEVSAVDDDDAARGNGPPFHFSLDLSSSRDEIQSSFAVEYNAKGAGGNGTATVFSLRGFDREIQKTYYLPIAITDSGNPPLTGISALVITIGDENDSLMESGDKQVLVYTHENHPQDTQIGRVYVKDPDDWDLTDKTFNWADKPHSNFILEEDSGMVTMTAATRRGQYFLEFLVHDHKHLQYNVKASVAVSVNYVPEKVIVQAASLRIAKITDEDFIQTWNYMKNYFIKSKADLFREKVAKLLNTVADNVHIFSLRLKKSRPPVTDLRFTVFDGQHYEAGILNALLMENKEDIERYIGLSIIMIGLNECLDENVPCDGSCTSKFVLSYKPYLVDANRTSIVSVNVEELPECVCQATDNFNENLKRHISCHPNPCKNNGKCIKGKDEIRCQCPSGFRGPRCQMLTRTFEGNGYSWFPSLATCGQNHLSVEFLTLKNNGLIFFNSAFAVSLERGHFSKEFISLELENGKLRLLVNYGSVTVQLKINGTENIADGQWHRVDLFLDTRNVRMEVDHCMTAVVQEPHEERKGIFDTSSCRAETKVPSSDRYLNVNGPLQVGGIRPHSFLRNPQNTFTPNGQSFSGCIRNLMLNGYLYDFSEPLLQNNTHMKCKPFENICKGDATTTSNKLPGRCDHGHCEGSLSHPICICQPGWTGKTCSEQTVPTYFGNDSFVKYALFLKPNTYSITVQLRFRTWEETGILLHMSNQFNQEFGALQIEKSCLLFRFNTNSHLKEEQTIQLSHINVSDGEWHLAAVSRFGLNVILSLDEGDGKWYNESFKSDSRHLLMDVDLQEGIIIGGKVRYSGVDIFTVEDDYKQGCIDDIRLDGHLLPLPPNTNGTRWAQAADFQNIVENCISDDQCTKVGCLAPLVCKSLWMKHECSCKEGSVLSNDRKRCLPIDVCSHNPCMNGGTCSLQGTSYWCRCFQGYRGMNCQLSQESPDARFSLGVVAVSILFLIVLIIGVVVFLVYKKPKRRTHKGKLEDTQMKGLRIKDDSRLEGYKGESTTACTTLDLTAITLPPITDNHQGDTVNSFTPDKVKEVNLAIVDVLQNIQGKVPSEGLPNILHVDCKSPVSTSSCKKKCRTSAECVEALLRYPSNFHLRESTPKEPFQ
ncbi:neural-cadherin-like [Palaemon carinicauda]|uniref:neural-cadherin-like n=1 Tax=Palaemon carinicauda TaxID=392227 RepID=UPI0035B60BD5